MKTNFKRMMIALLSLLLLSAFTTQGQSDKDQKDQTKKHLRLVKVENGQKTVIDTIVSGNEDIDWIDKLGITEDVDSALDGDLKNIKVKVMDDGKNQKVWVFSGDDDHPMHWKGSNMSITTETSTDGDSITKVMIIKHDDGKMEKVISGDISTMIHVPDPPLPPKTHVKVLKQISGDNIIDLNDKDIISYKKKDLSGGREKIEIIRKNHLKRNRFYKESPNKQ